MFERVMICDAQGTYGDKQAIKREKELFRRMIASRVDGIIFVSSVSTENREKYFSQIKKQANKYKNIPLVSIERDLTSVGIDSVYFDGYANARMATQHLIECGCKKIGHITGPTHMEIVKERVKGYKDCLKENNLYLGEEMIAHGDYRGIVRSVVLIPWVTPCVLISLMWAWIFNGNYGVMNEILQKLHLINENVAWIAQPNTALWIQILAMIWQGIPFFTIMILAAMQSVPRELYESASVDGASRIKQYFYITIPGIASTIVSTVMIRLIWVFNNVDIIYTMTGGGPGYSSLTLSVYTYLQAQKSMKFGYGSAVAIIGAVFMSIVIFIYLRITREQGGMIDK